MDPEHPYLFRWVQYSIKHSDKGLQLHTTCDGCCREVAPTDGCRSSWGQSRSAESSSPNNPPSVIRKTAALALRLRPASAVTTAECVAASVWRAGRAGKGDPCDRQLVKVTTTGLVFDYDLQPLHRGLKAPHPIPDINGEIILKWPYLCQRNGCLLAERMAWH